jgi:hypothetical protein
MSAARAALLKRLEEVATKDWLAVLRDKYLASVQFRFAILWALIS